MTILRPRLRRSWREFCRAAVDLLLPQHCLTCGIPAADPLCAGCLARLLRREPPWCGRCGTPLWPGQPCPEDHRLLTGLRFCRSPFGYAGTGGALVRRLKLSAEFGAVPRLGAAMANALADVRRGAFRRAVLVPVPLHRERRRHRGFDQAELLAAEVARRTGLEVRPALARVRATLPQGDPRVTSRSRNVELAFAVRRARDLAGRHVVLVDDVATSFATARACAAVVRAAGAVEVGLLAACRA